MGTGYGEPPTAAQMRDEIVRLREALVVIRGVHGPHHRDDRLCAEGCSGAYPCTTRIEVDAVLGPDL